MYPEFEIAEGKNVAVPFVCYEEYVDNIESFEDDGMPFATYLKKRSVVAQLPCNIPGYGFMTLPGEMFKSDYEVTTEVGKRITRGILKAIWKNGKTGRCFSDFNSSNIFISVEGKVKFKGVKRLVKTKIELGIQLRQNYLQARVMIHDMFLKAVKKKIPEDIEHLLNMILNKPGKSELYHIHASLVPEATRWCIYVKMYDHLIHKVPEDIRETILLGLPYLADWKTKLLLNTILMAVYNFKADQYDVTEEKTKEKYEKTGRWWSLLTAEEKNRKMKVMKEKKFADFLRNRTAHRMESVQHDTAEGSDRVTHVRFPIVIAHIQEELFDKNEMAELLLEQFF